MQVNQNAQNIASVGAAVGSSELQEVSQELIDSIVGQIPEVISYEANAKGIQTQNAVSDTLLNLKA
jgi:flagellar hook protein FlgE